MNKIDLLQSKTEELEKKVKEYNDCISQIQSIQKTQNEIGQELLRLDGAIKTLKELDNNE